MIFLEGRTRSTTAAAKRPSSTAPSLTSPLTNYFQTLGRSPSIVRESPTSADRPKRARSETSWSSPYFAENKNTPFEAKQSAFCEISTKEVRIKLEDEASTACEAPSEPLVDPAESAEPKPGRTKLIHLQEGTFTLEVFGTGRSSPLTPALSHSKIIQATTGCFKLNVYS